MHSARPSKLLPTGAACRPMCIHCALPHKLLRTGAACRSMCGGRDPDPAGASCAVAPGHQGGLGFRVRRARCPSTCPLAGGRGASRPHHPPVLAASGMSVFNSSGSGRKKQSNSKSALNCENTHAHTPKSKPCSLLLRNFVCLFSSVCSLDKQTLPAIHTSMRWWRCGEGEQAAGLSSSWTTWSARQKQLQ